MADTLAIAFLDIVCRRELFAMGRAGVASPSRRAAARAVTLAPTLVTDLRRVTRWLALREPESREDEEVREWDCLPGRPEAEEWEREERC